MALKAHGMSSAQAADADRHDVQVVPYHRSYHWLRVFAGFFGILLPVGLVAGEAWLLDATEWESRGSLSEYYHSGMRDAFVGVLVIVGILLVTYKFPDVRDPEFWISLLAGLAAITVAVVPTSIPCELREFAPLDCEARMEIRLPFQDKARPTALQNAIGEETAEQIHYRAAVVFIAFLFLMSARFAWTEWRDLHDAGEPRIARFSWLTGKAWAFHLLMAALILAGGVYIFVARALDFPTDREILHGEVMATVGFGLSWLAKGSHWTRLFPATSG